MPEAVKQEVKAIFPEVKKQQMLAQQFNLQVVVARSKILTANTFNRIIIQKNSELLKIIIMN
jgi:hypothetical protein